MLFMIQQRGPEVSNEQHINNGYWCNTRGISRHCFLLDHFPFDQFLFGVVNGFNVIIQVSNVRRCYLADRQGQKTIKPQSEIILNFSY